MRDTGISADERCPGSTTMGNAVGGGARIPLGATGTTTFTAPTGMTIADFTLTRQLTYRNGAPADGTRRLYALYALGGTVFAGAGHYDNATRNRLNAVGSWYGYPEKNIVVPRSTVSRASFPALAGYAGTAKTLQIAVGCFNGSVNTACSVAARRRHLEPALRRAGRPQRPDRARRVDRGLGPARRRRALGLRPDHARRQRQRRDPARRARSTSPRAARASSAPRTTRPAGTPTRARPARSACARPARTSRTRPSARRPARRPADAQGPHHRRRRQRDRAGALRRLDVATPSDRGPLNGTGATEDGTLSAHFTGTHQDAPHRRLPLAGSRISGRLLNSAGRPIAGAAAARAHPRPPPGARFVDRYTTTTGSDGDLPRARCARPPRAPQIAWRSHTNDPGFQESAYVTLNARASSSLRARPRTVGVGGRLRLSGTVRGTVPSRGVPLIFQGRMRRGRYTTFADGRANRKGRFRIRYRFRSAALARAHVQLPRQAPRRRPLPLRARLLQARDRPRPLRPLPETK